MNIAIIGCGAIGRKRAMAIKSKHHLVAVADVDSERAIELAQKYGCKYYCDWRQMLFEVRVDIVIIATTNNMLAEITIAAMQAGSHVLVEKPAAVSAIQLRDVHDLTKKYGRQVKVGYNLRFHSAIRKAYDVFTSGEIGNLLFVRGRYGHGGRLGYEKEWRAYHALSGGGELIDQGVHLIDLARWFLGDFCNVQGVVRNYFWNMPVEDNVFMTLSTIDNKTAFLQASCTEWKNMFSLEIYGQTGKLQIDGLGGSYGVERLTFYKMQPQMGPPDTVIWEYPQEDNSWSAELEYFVECINANNKPMSNVEDSLAVLEVVEKIYRSNGQ